MIKRIAIGAALGGIAAFVSGRRAGSSAGGSTGSGETSVFGRVKNAVRGGGSKLAEVGHAAGGQAAGLAHKAGEQAGGVVQKVTNRGGEKAGSEGDERGAASDSGVDDATLARKVETEIFRERDAPKGSVDVNVQEGVVQLRGEIERPELAEELVERAREVQGVRDVENLLHLPGEPAPMHQ